MYFLGEMERDILLKSTTGMWTFYFWWRIERIIGEQRVFFMAIAATPIFCFEAVQCVFG